MPLQKTEIHSFLSLAKHYPVFDVRSPAEFAHAHIPGAHSLPIFNDNERKEIGTSYKQVSREDAIKKGLRYFGPNMEDFVTKVEQAMRNYASDDKKVLVHCWRGGMRSGAMAWLLGFYGFDVHVLDGGYKAYRNHILTQLELPFRLNIIGGYTGSGKTEVLHQLQKRKIAVVDIEAIANHKGSAFGGFGQGAQPSQEQFENNLHHALTAFYFTENGVFNQAEPIWVENESQRIGALNLPNSFYQTMQHQPAYVIDVPFEERLEYIVKHYGTIEKEKLVNAIIRIQKKLGGLDTKNAVNFLLENNVHECFRILLSYYDKRYKESSEKNERKPVTVSASVTSAEQTAGFLLNQHTTH
ncbi:MAG: tRNA 2-selenouridine(34) synthase MnmH [Bacteroidota bacterium]